ncbi:MAG TPA: hypothetical protein VLC09_10345, partial [Polyangiaceae bacterium]|nr:hypothetical protein [Polyangiaceae bacterium]
LCLLGGTLFLPERVMFDFPVVPPLDKNAIAALAAYVACLVADSDTVLGPQQSRATRWILILLAINVIGTVVTNGDAMRFGPLVLPGMSAYDGLATFIRTSLYIALPFFLGQALFRTCEDLRELLSALVIGALVYVPLVLLEARLSPIFHIKLYGFFQHSFAQSARDGGFRAFVFMSHGLTVAFFVSQSVTASVSLGALRVRLLGFSSKLITTVLVVALISCKSLGAFLYAGTTAPLIWLTKARTQLRVAAYLAFAVLNYPLLRMFDWISTEWFLEQASRASADRAQSLEYRFMNEGMLLTKAQERPYFGWGAWGRNLLYDPASGRDITVVDGEWIIQFGAAGAMGFLIVFGLLLSPVWRARRAERRSALSAQDAQTLASVALLLAFTGLDLIPNSTSHCVPFLLAGALTSVSSGLLAGSITRTAAA